MTRTFTPAQLDYLNTTEITSFTIHTGGVYELAFLANGKESTDRFLHMIRHLTEGETSQDPPLRILVDCAQGVPTVTYVLNQIREMSSETRERVPVRLVMMLGGGKTYLSMTETLIQSLRIRGFKARILTPSERQRAIDWLLRDD